MKRSRATNLFTPVLVPDISFQRILFLITKAFSFIFIPSKKQNKIDYSTQLEIHAKLNMKT